MDRIKAKRIILVGVLVSIVISTIQWGVGLSLVEEISPQIFIAILKSIGIALFGILLINQSYKEHKQLWFLGGLYLIAMPLYFGGLTAYKHLVLDYGFRIDHLVLSYAKHTSLLITVPAYIFLARYVAKKSNT